MVDSASPTISKLQLPWKLSESKQILLGKQLLLKSLIINLPSRPLQYSWVSLQMCPLWPFYLT